MLHPHRRMEVLKAEKIPGLLVLCLAVPSLLYASFVKQSLVALWGAVLGLLGALLYLVLSSDKSSLSVALTLLSALTEVLRAVFTAISSCINMARNRAT